MEESILLGIKKSEYRILPALQCSVKLTIFLNFPIGKDSIIIKSDYRILSAYLDGRTVFCFT